MAGTRRKRGQRGCRRPKRQAVLALLGEYAGEIEADLAREYGLDIAGWYRGEVSSRSVLTRIANLSDRSAFKLAQDWPLTDHLLAAVVNEVKAMRGDLWALIGRERMSFRPILPPSALRAQKAKRTQIRALHDDIVAELRGQKAG